MSVQRRQKKWKTPFGEFKKQAQTGVEKYASKYLLSLEPVWPDWAIFRSSWLQIFFHK